MNSQTLQHESERQYFNKRLIFLSIITFAGFILASQVDEETRKKIFLGSLALAGLIIASTLQYLFISRTPHLFVAFRRILLIFLDLSVLTFIIFLSEEYGIFLLPVYIIITMHSGIHFGKEYFYFSIILASLSWLVLVKSSSYWYTHYEVIATFAMTTILIPLFYLDKFINADKKNTELRDKLTEVSHDAMYDELTGLANRKTYKLMIKAMLEQKAFFALLFIDINKIKTINSTYGHYFGDEILKEVARRMAIALGEEDFFARLRGSEFVIITQKKKAFLPKLIENLEQAIIGEYESQKVKVLIEPSIGISIYPDDTKEEVMLAKFADEAMYVAENRPDTYHVFYESIVRKNDSIGTPLIDSELFG